MTTTISPVTNLKTTKSQSSLVDLVDQLLAGPNLDLQLATKLLSVRESLTPPVQQGAPFLSVLLRTQGHRIEPMKDSLLCLAAQSDQDFEVIVIDHNADLEGAADVRRIIAEQPPGFRERIRVIEVVGGGRSAPLNAGVAAAQGEYICVFDDDDLVFANWVEEFHKASELSSGRMLRAVSATQRVKPEVWPQNQSGFRTLSSPHAEYAKEFDLLDHLRVNHTPFMSLAFPRNLFSVIGLTFDEELMVCEDWDIILRGSSLAGVDQIPALTSIYRRWDGGKSSYTDHTISSWREAEKRVIGQINDSVLLAPPGSAEHIRHLLEVEAEGQHARLQLIHLTHSREWRWTKPLRVALRAASLGKFTVNRIARRIRRLGKF